MIKCRMNWIKNFMKLLKIKTICEKCRVAWTLGQGHIVPHQVWRCAMTFPKVFQLESRRWQKKIKVQQKQCKRKSRRLWRQWLTQSLELISSILDLFYRVDLNEEYCQVDKDSDNGPPIMILLQMKFIVLSCDWIEVKTTDVKLVWYPAWVQIERHAMQELLGY